MQDGRMRIAAALAVVGLGLAPAAGCGAGQTAATAEQVAATYGAGGEIGQIAVRNAQFAFDGPVLARANYLPGDTAPLRVSIVNTGDSPDRLLAVESPIATTVSITGPTVLPGGQVLTAGYAEPLAAIPTQGTTEIDIAFVGLTTPLRAGLNYPVSFAFERAGTLQLQVPIAYPDDIPAPRAGEEPPGPEEVLETGPEIPVVPE